jgi:hypothetical protein
MSHEEQLKILATIAKINFRLSDEEFLKGLNGDSLSYIGVRLASLKASILDVKYEAEKSMHDLELEKDKAKALAYLEAKKEHGTTAAGDIKYSNETLQEAIKNYNDAKANYNKLRSIASDAHDLIDSIKSRVIDMQGARRDERLG